MRNRRRYVLSFVLSQLLTVSVWAQPTATSDSLLRYLRTAKQDTTYVRAANEYAWWLINHIDNLDRADSLLNQMEDLAKRLNDSMGLGRVYFYKGRVYQRRPESENIALALAYFQKAYNVAVKSHLPPTELQRALTGIGESYSVSNQPEKGLVYLLKAIQVTERHKLTDYVTLAYGQVGDIMNAMGNQQRAYEYYQKAYALAYSDKDKYLVLDAESRMAYILEVKGEYRQALSHLHKALAWADKYGNLYWKIQLWNSAAYCYRQLGLNEQAFHYLKLAERYAPGDKPQSQMATSREFGDYYSALGNYQKAEYYYLNALKLAVELVETSNERDITSRLARLYHQTHQYEKAHPYLIRLLTLNDSLYSLQNAVRLRDLETKLETEKRENQIRLLDQQKQSAQFQRNAWIVGALLLVVLAAAISAWLLNRAKVRRLQEAQTLRQQIAHDLHDEVGSTLSSISMLSGHTDTLLRQNRPEQAQKTVQKIYTDARQILESIDEIIWTINPGNDTLHRIALRLQEYAQPLMESKGIVLHFLADSSLDDHPVSMEVRRSLYLIGKEAINNLVKYSQATQATVRFEKHDNQLRVLIEDNGQGFDTAQQSGRTGQASMKQRALAMGGSLEIRSMPKEGTRLILTTSLT
ncbi:MULTISPECIES: tetratricopeptide repeat protein [unclassified Spirosoma]|uniref:tetratricopeptide repeat-containing sensor histidine kinase n=1 Tax=unclassified Spirosoma TaxID=2621999 RepID=UPI0009620B69|nr:MULTISPECIES: tetratricopeptide repeat protein [unclassified Spirosoma]MBN8826326.1 hypothetical protein [Spirosoma sp.]OJW76155.1 MAG: hypothetical protein BGO59_03245 [Spirosoma sp. 48-14]